MADDAGLLKSSPGGCPQCRCLLILSASCTVDLVKEFSVPTRRKEQKLHFTEQGELSQFRCNYVRSHTLCRNVVWGTVSMLREYYTGPLCPC